MSRLHLLEIMANASGRSVSPAGLRALAWAECLMRARRPSQRRVEACCAALKREFDL